MIRTAAVPETRHVALEVSDTGPGVSAEVRARLFEPFFSTKPRGLGIGLAISRSIVESHGGRIWAAPNVPKGTVFHFTLPTPAGMTARRAPEEPIRT